MICATAEQERALGRERNDREQKPLQQPGAPSIALQPFALAREMAALALGPGRLHAVQALIVLTRRCALSGAVKTAQHVHNPRESVTAADAGEEK